MVIPEPLNTLLIASQPNKLMAILRLSDPLLGICSIIPSHPSAPDDQDIRRVELNTLLLGNGFDVLDTDLVSTGSRVPNPFLLGPRRIVDEDTSSDDPTSFRPVVLAVIRDVRGVGDLLVLEPVVVKSCVLVSPVAETIPLRTALGVDVDEVVPGDETEGLEIFKIVLEFLAREAWFVNVLESPAGVDL